MPQEPARSYWPFILIALGAILLIAVVIGLMSTVFHTAEATVTVAEWKSDISGTYTAGGTAPITYEPTSVEERASKSVPATGTTEAEDHASGTIVVTNMGTEQRLITNTRFETKEGLIYRIHTPIVVPAAVTKGGTKTPGSIEAIVYADQPGDKYNVTNADFTIPGLKGGAQFELITAKSKGAMSGGFVGTRAKVEKSTEDAAVSELKAGLDRALRDKLLASHGEGTVVFADSIEINYRTEPAAGADSGNATITVVGTARAPAFSADALSVELAGKAQIAAGGRLVLKNASELSYTAGPGGNVDAAGALSFTLSGVAHLASEFAPLKLSYDLSGKSETEVESVRVSYPSLVGPINLTVYPFWMSTLPDEPEQITVIVKGALDQNL
ncbi:MAG: hypothetical protein AAB955_01090 [Patescibacteria group bacterium]